MCSIWADTVHNGTASHCSQNLSNNVEKGSEHAHLAAGQQAQGDGRVQVGAADVTYTLSYCGDGQAKGKQHLYLLVGVRIVSVPYCSREADEDKDDHALQISDMATQITPASCLQTVF